MAVCRECAAEQDAVNASNCAACGAARLVCHPELGALAIAHLDCDAFYATIEKRDDPSLRDQPVVVGGRKRGVVMAACYIARRYGIHSAMPMFQALERCPHAAVVRPDMEKYVAVGREVREMMLAVTPLVEPLSVDEAFLDLSGTAELHRTSPAASLAALVRRIERELDIIVSVGLSYNKFLAKLLSDLDKPRGFAVVGRADAQDFLADKPVRLIWGVGKVFEQRLLGDGIQTIGALRQHSERELVARYGRIGRRLSRFAAGRDERAVSTSRSAKSVSAETTFGEDIADVGELKSRLRALCDRVARRLRRSELAAHGVTLKLKTSNFKIMTRSRRLTKPTQRGEVLYRTAVPLLEREARGERYRLIGIGGHALMPADIADPPDLFDEDGAKGLKLEGSLDALRHRFGDDAVRRGSAPPPRPGRPEV